MRKVNFDIICHDALEGSMMSIFSLPLARILLKEQLHRLEFFDNYYQVNKNLIDDLMDYRKSRLNTKTYSVDEFLKSCIYTENIKNIFEDTFLQEFTDNDMKIIGDKIFNNHITLDYIYEMFEKNPSINVVRYVL